MRIDRSLLLGEADSLAHYRIAKRGLSGTTEYFVQFEPGDFKGDPALLLPQLLDEMVALGEKARYVSQALGGNGHRPEQAQKVVEQLVSGRHG